MTQPRFAPQVFIYADAEKARRPVLVFRKGRTLYHAIVATHDAIKLDTFETLRGLQPMAYRDGEYPPRRAASFWLNHDHRPITKRARAVLRGMMARKPKIEAA